MAEWKEDPELIERAANAGLRAILAETNHSPMDVAIAGFLIGVMQLKVNGVSDDMVHDFVDRVLDQYAMGGCSAQSRKVKERLS